MSADQIAPAAPAAGAAPPAAPGPQRLRAAFGLFATGITVVTTGRPRPCGMTANSFTSVSLDPALALVCVKRDAAFHHAVLETGAFAVSVLAAGQERLARHFADSRRPRGEREFDAVDTRPGPRTGAPLLAGALAWLELRLAAVYDGGDHAIFLGSVLEVGTGAGADCEPRPGAGADPLVYFRGGFARLGEGA